VIIAQAHASLQACLQAGWGKNGGTRKKPQSEDKIKRDASFGCLEWEGGI